MSTAWPAHIGLTWQTMMSSYIWSQSVKCQNVDKNDPDNWDNFILNENSDTLVAGITASSNITRCDALICQLGGAGWNMRIITSPDVRVHDKSHKIVVWHISAVIGSLVANTYAELTIKAQTKIHHIQYTKSDQFENIGPNLTNTKCPGFVPLAHNLVIFVNIIRVTKA